MNGFPKGETMTRGKRFEQLKEAIDRLGFATMKELADVVDISEATVRRDIGILDAEGAVKKVSGGVVSLKRGILLEPSLRARSTMNIHEKERIANAALKYVQDGDNIILDAGTTCLALAHQLDNSNDLTVVTYDMQTAAALARFPGINIILAGGILRRNHGSFYGYFTENVFREIHANRAFLSCDSLSLERGIMSYTSDDINVKRQMIKSSDEVILLCDHSKFEVKTFISIAPATAVTRIITGYETPSPTIDGLRNRDIEVEVV